ncbi:MDR family oxidoreductase [Paraburkholderia phymatum]|uniref:Quinone oxidoreductase, YhdH/YhfP family n=2 Tax=Paraburkholderia phymatum TaxID=148447 RepID=B2JRK8_PARP8|nr:MDR family oxidoreductase [Paraburkholderia phymatum]ACC72335.1 quinone oxidoreductase, YhdH/YhfP family [Paraburkholderia phymatum STM815]
MMTQTKAFKAMLLREKDRTTTSANLETLTVDQLPEGDTLVQIDYSTLNFKDALAVTGNGKIVKTWPMVPGVDFSGTVVETTHPRLAIGQRVVLTGWSVGEKHWGGYSQYQRIRGDWLVPIPEGLDSRLAMMIGTAGFTAMLCVIALERSGVTPTSGAVLVTGAGGGVGSVAVTILSALGYSVSALTGDVGKHEYVLSLGAKECVDGPVWKDAPRPLEAQRWSAAIDTVGSNVLARVLAEMNYGGTVAACGLAGGPDLPTTVMPFILRGVRLLGVDSVMLPYAERLATWQRVSRDLPKAVLERIAARTVSLDEVRDAASDLLSGKLKGRVLVDVNK